MNSIEAYGKFLILLPRMHSKLRLRRIRLLFCATLVYVGAGFLRLIHVPSAEVDGDLWNRSNILFQKLPDPRVSVTAKLTFHPQCEGEETGLVSTGQSYACIGVRDTGKCLAMRPVMRTGDEAGDTEESSVPVSIPGGLAWLRANVIKGGEVGFGHGMDGTPFQPTGLRLHTQSERRIGATVGPFVTGMSVKR